GSNVPREIDITYNIQKYKNENQFLIGTRAVVILFDFKKSTFKYLYNKTGVKNTIGPGPCRLVFRKDDNFYAAPSSGGIYLIEEEDNQLIATTKHEFTPLKRVSKDYFSDV